MSHPDELELMLTRELRDRADPLHGIGFGVDAVMGRAQELRRRRRVVVGVTAAAVIAVAVPIVVAAGGALRTQTEIDPAPSPDPPRVVRTTLTLDGLDRGDSPAVEYFSPDGVVLPSEGLQPLSMSYQALVPNPGEDGWVAVAPLSEITYLDQAFQPTGGSPAVDGLVTTPDRDWVAWVEEESGARTLVLHSTTDAEAGMTWDLSDRPDATQVGFVAEDRVVFQTGDFDEPKEVFIAEPDRSTTQLPGYVDAVSANPTTGLVAVQSTPGPEGSGCYGVVDPDAGSEPLWETCQHLLGAFSPDGRLVMGGLNYQPGVSGVASLEVLDARTGAVVAQFRRPEGSRLALSQPVWETPDSVVAVALEGPETAMVRLHMNGSLEEIADRGPDGWNQDVYYYFGSDRTSFHGRPI